MLMFVPSFCANAQQRLTGTTHLRMQTASVTLDNLTLGNRTASANNANRQRQSQRATIHTSEPGRDQAVCRITNERHMPAQRCACV